MAFLVWKMWSARKIFYGALKEGPRSKYFWGILQVMLLCLFMLYAMSGFFQYAVDRIP